MKLRITSFVLFISGAMIMSFCSCKKYDHTADVFTTEFDAYSWQRFPKIYGDVYDMEVYQGKLWIAGEFDRVDGETVWGCLSYDGTTFSKHPVTTAYYSPAQDLLVQNDTLYLGGEFDMLNPSNNMSYWNGGNFAPVADIGVDRVFRLVTYTNRLYSSYGWSNQRGVARRQGNSWIDMGNNFSYAPLAFSVFNNDLYAAGNFTSAQGNYLVRYNGVGWATTGNFNNPLSALGNYNGSILAGGAFTSFNSIPCSRLAENNGTGWVEFNGGTDGSVTEIYPYGSDLYIAGYFNRVGGTVDAFGIAKWNGTNWLAVGNGGLDQGVTSLAIYNGYLYAGGIDGLWRIKL